MFRIQVSEMNEVISLEMDANSLNMSEILQE